jgi:hypothetical protein
MNDLNVNAAAGAPANGPARPAVRPLALDVALALALALPMLLALKCDGGWGDPDPTNFCPRPELCDATGQPLEETTGADSEGTDGTTATTDTTDTGGTTDTGDTTDTSGTSDTTDTGPSSSDTTDTGSGTDTDGLLVCGRDPGNPNGLGLPCKPKKSGDGGQCEKANKNLACNCDLDPKSVACICVFILCDLKNPEKVCGPNATCCKPYQPGTTVPSPVPICLNDYCVPTECGGNPIYPQDLVDTTGGETGDAETTGAE